MSNNPMPGNDPLSQLKPIIYPEHAVSWWPLAPGWWGLIVLLFIAAMLFYWIRPIVHKRKIARDIQRYTLDQLQECYQACKSDGDQGEAITRYYQTSNALLKRLANYHLPDKNIGSLSGKQWTSFLHQYRPPDLTDYSDRYGNQIYSNHVATDTDLQQLHQWAHAWIERFHHECRK